MIAEVTSGPDGDIVAYDLIAQVFGTVFLQSQTVIFLILIPVLQTDDQIHLLGIPDGGCTEKSLYIHNTDTS